MTSSLSPAQQRAADRLLGRWPCNNLFLLSGQDGTGRSTVLRDLHRRLGGTLLGMRDLVEAMPGRHPLTLEDALTQCLQSAWAHHPHVFLDDLHLLTQVVAGGCNPYPRGGWLNAHLEALCQQLMGSARKLLVASDGWWPNVFDRWADRAGIHDFGPEDYAFFGQTFLDADRAGRLDFARVHRFAPDLSPHQWRTACSWLQQQADLDTERLISYFRAEGLTSNVDLEEVEQVSLRDLRGVDDVVQALETHVVLPLENDELATRFHLRPKRGVLLLGPPGTGKTTVGRALAHRLQGKFFLVDGTFISGTDSFYGQIHHVFRQAQRNAPSVLFIDDSDVIFRGHKELGLYRYLLTMLDGLESARAGRVCVMLTAMEVDQLPPALLRSGRIELWLEMKLPDEAARAAILGQYLAGWPAEQGEVDVTRLAAVTTQLTGADLKRLAEDGKNLLAFDLALGHPPRPATDYFLDALEALQANQRRYAEAEARARQHC